MLDDLVCNGFTVVRDAVERRFVDQLAERIASLSIDHSEVYRTFGFDWPPLQAVARAILRRFGFCDIAPFGTYLIPKLPNEPPRPWHQDWRWWSSPETADELPIQLGVLFYLQRTTPKNGATKVMAGSHRRFMSEVHLNAGIKTLDGESSVCVSPCDVLILDPRVMHASHANKTDTHRWTINAWHFVRPWKQPPHPQFPEKEMLEFFGHSA